MIKKLFNKLRKEYQIYLEIKADKKKLKQKQEMISTLMNDIIYKKD